jgi:putative ABC transport system substrate-binding protein
MGFLGLGPVSAWASRVEALRQGLRDLGYIEGKNIVIEFRWADGVDQLPEFAAEFVRMNVDIIFAASSTMVEAARQATKTIPIVFAYHADPVSLGHVASLARPGGNITGLANLLADLVAKDLEILTQALPEATRIGVLWNPTNPSHQLALKAAETAGEKLGVKLVMVPARSADDFEGAFSTMSREGVTGLVVVSSPLSVSQSARLAALALKYRLPGVSGIKI